MTVHDTDQRYRDARAAAALETDDGIPADDLRRVYSRVRRSLHAQETAPKRSLRPWFIGALTLAATASVVVTVGVPLVRRATWMQHAPAVGPATVVLSSGDVHWHTAATTAAEAVHVETLPRGSHVRMGPGARFALQLGRAAQMITRGPGSLTLSPSGQPHVVAGVALFSVARHPTNEPFVVRVGDAEVLVRGTRFAVAAEAGRLVWVTVTEGTVETRPANASPRLLGRGQSYGAVPPDEHALAAAEDYAEPWWTSERADKLVQGYVEITADPADAAVELDGVGVGSAPAFVRVTAGEHLVRAHAQGFVARQEQVVVASGGTHRVALSLSLSLSPVESRPDVAPSTTPRREPTRTTIDPFLTAREYLERRQCDKLARHVETLVRRATDDEGRAQAQVLAAECYVRTGKKRQAMQIFDGVGRRYGSVASGAPALFEAGKLMAELGMPKEALATFERYLTLHPRGELASAASFRRCGLLIGMERLGDARTCLLGLRQSFPSDHRVSEATLLLASIARVQRDWRVCAERYAEYLEAPSAPRAEEAMYHRLVCLEQARDPQLAAAAKSYLSRFPRGEHAEHVRRMMAR